MDEARLLAFQEAWNSHDADLVVSFMADDCVWHTPSGPGFLGRTYAGIKEIRAAVQTFFDGHPDGRWEDIGVMVSGSRGAADWTFISTDASGETQRVKGCDIFEFRGPEIVVKSGFRKARE